MPHSALPPADAACAGYWELAKLDPMPQGVREETVVGRHLIGVWIGGIWNGHFPESEKYLSGPEFSRKIPEMPQKAIFAKFQAPKFENSEPEKSQFHTPSRSIPLLSWSQYHALLVAKWLQTDMNHWDPFDQSEGQFSLNVKKSEKSLEMGSRGLPASGVLKTS